MMHFLCVKCGSAAAFFPVETLDHPKLTGRWQWQFDPKSEQCHKNDAVKLAAHFHLA